MRTVEEIVEDLVKVNEQGMVQIGTVVLRAGAGNVQMPRKSVESIVTRVRSIIVAAVSEAVSTGGSKTAAPGEAQDQATPAADAEADRVRSLNARDVQIVKLTIDAIAEHMKGLFGSSDPKTQIDMGTARQAAAERAGAVSVEEILAKLGLPVEEDAPSASEDAANAA